MQKMIKLLCLSLALLMLLAALAACDDQGKGGMTTTTTENPQGPTDPVDPVDENGYIRDHIDRNAIDYGGDRLANVLAWSQNKDMLYPEQMADGEALSNDVYLRNQQIEQDLGIRFNPTFKSSHMGGFEEPGDELFNEALEGRTLYDAIVCYSHFPAKMAVEGILCDLTSLSFPEVDMPWYPDGVKSWGVYNRLFFIANNSCVQNILASWCMFANKTMIEAKGLEDIEQVVIDGRWTLDVLKTYSRKWASEAEGNEAKAEEDRVYGFSITHRTAFNGFYYGAGFNTYTKDENDFPKALYFDKSHIEQVSNFVDTFLDICDSPEFVMGGYSPDIYYPLENKNTAFFAASLNSYERLDDYTYCMIPMPKLNEAQENYCTLLRDISELWCVPSYSDDPELGGLIIEATASSDFRTMAPKFFDNDFKYRYSSSENGVKIFDLIRSSYTTDFGPVWINVGTPFGTLWNCIDHTPNDDPQNTMQNTYATSVPGTKSQANVKLRALKNLVDKLYPQ